MMAAGTTAAVPDLRTGVIAIDGRLSMVPGCTRPPDGPPGLVRDDPAREPGDGALQAKVVARALEARASGGAVT